MRDTEADTRIFIFDQIVDVYQIDEIYRYTRRMKPSFGNNNNSNRK